MRKEKRVRHEYEAIGPVPQQFGANAVFGVAVPFQRMDTGATVWVRIRDMAIDDVGEKLVVRFNGTIPNGIHEGEAISGEYNGVTQKATLVTWFEL